MNNDNNSFSNGSDATVRPEQMMNRTFRPQESISPVNMMQQQAQQQAQTKVCPFCGTVNEAEAMFCAQCGHPISKANCPFCGAEMDPDADFCEVCHRYTRKDVCSFCGARLAPEDEFCSECGSPRGGIVCPVCHTQNEFAFCKKCGTALTEEARQLVKQLQLNPEYKELMEIVRDYGQLENALPYNTERDMVQEQMCQKLRERVLTLLAKDDGEELPVIPPVETKRMTKEELNEQKAVKVKMLSAILEKLAVAPTASPVKARNFAMASKPQGVRLAWVCNWKHALHSSPCGCAKPHLGGKWVVMGSNITGEIKDDK